MSAQEVLEFIFKTRKEGNGERQVQEGLKQTEQSAKDTGTALKSDLKDGAASALEAFTGLSLTSLSVAGAIGGVAVAAKAAIDGFVEQANATRDLSTAFGISAEQASAYQAIAGDLRIESSQLEMAFKTLSAQGIQPTIANLMAISEEYLAIQDPVERAQYAQEKFGRSAIDMARFLELGADGIAAAAQEAKDYGLTLDDKALAANERYRAAMDRLGDTTDSLTLQFGELGANALSSLVEGFAGASQATMTFGINLYNAFGIVNNADAAILKQAVDAGDLTATLRYLTDGIDAVGGAQVDLGGKTLGLSDDLGEAKQAMREMEDASRDAKDAQDDLTESTGFAQDTYRDAAKALRDHNMAEEDRIKLEQTLKILSGEVTLEDLDRKRAVDDVTTALMNGKITQSEYITLMQDLATGAGTAAEKLDRVRDAMLDIPEHRKVVLEYNIQVTGQNPGSTELGDEDFGGWTGGSGASGGGSSGAGGSGGGGGRTPKKPASNGSTVDKNTKPGTANALGGAMFAGGTTIINDSPLTTPELVVVDRDGNGQVLTQQQAMAAVSGPREGDTVQIFVDARGALNPRDVERAGERGVRKALRDAGLRADRKTRTS